MEAPATVGRWRSLRYTFRDKLLLSFSILLVATVAPVLVIVNAQIETISADKIEQDLRNSRTVFRRFQETQLVSDSEKVTAFILTQPGIRAEIATSATGQETSLTDVFGEASLDEAFGTPASGDALAADATAGKRPPEKTVRPSDRLPRRLRAGAEADDRAGRILSVVQETNLYAESAVFFLADFRGRFVFSKNHPAGSARDLTRLPGVVGALQGNDIFTWWGSQDRRFRDSGMLPPDRTQRLFQVFLKPIQFGGEVKGVMGIGTAVTPQVLEAITGIARSEVAFISDGVVYVNSGTRVPAPILVSLAAVKQAAALDAMVPFAAGGEDFLALRGPVTSSLGEPVGLVIVYRSKTREKQAFDNLRLILNLIGVAALVMAGLLAFFISHSVSRAVRNLFQAVNEVHKGNLTHVVQVRSRDEFGDLERAFNEMTAGLREKETIRSTFKRYLSSSVVDELLRNPEDIKLGGDAKQITIQFSDIAGFTALSETMTPGQVVEFLNEYLSEMTREVEAHQGIVDKYIGDAVMAFWGSPVALENHALNACRAALAQMRKVDSLRRKWAGLGPLENFSVRLGLHTGNVIVGNIGSATRMDYTVIGDAVNTASRLEGMNKVYSTRAIISETTYEQVKPDMLCRELDLIRPVGKAEPVRIYELVSAQGNQQDSSAKIHAGFAEALALYRQAHFGEALRSFVHLAETTGDAPSRTFAQRCEAYLAAPPALPWDGVFSPHEK